MNKQVIDVYDGMAMPADCARCIEGEMSRAIRQKKGETKFMKNEKNGQKQSWGFAVVLVCLVLVLSVGGVFLFLNVSEPKDAPAAPAGTGGISCGKYGGGFLHSERNRQGFSGKDVLFPAGLVGRRFPERRILAEFSVLLFHLSGHGGR